MISYNILHYNRPYLLELNIKILRSLLPGIQIVVSDDGSDLPVIERIKKFDVDDFVTTEHRVCTNHDGSCSNAIEKGIKRCTQPFYIFCEDDFWYVGKNNTTDIKRIPEGLLAHKIALRDSTQFFGISEAINSLSDMDIILVKLIGSSVCVRQPVSVKHRVTNNWPYIMRTEERKKFTLEENQSIKSVQDDFFTKIKMFCGRHIYNTTTCSYSHVGAPFSVNISRYFHRQKGFTCWDSITQSNISSMSVSEYSIFITKILNNILHLYLNDKFFIDIDEMFQYDINTAFVSAVNRVKGEIC